MNTVLFCRAPIIFVSKQIKTKTRNFNNISHQEKTTK